MTRKRQNLRWVHVAFDIAPTHPWLEVPTENFNEFVDWLRTHAFLVTDPTSRSVAGSNAFPLLIEAPKEGE